MKKFYMFILVLVCSIYALFVVQAATKDTTAPVMTTFSVVNAKKTYEVGEIVDLKISANDDISGIRQAIVFLGEYDKDGAFSGTSVDVYDIGKSPYFIIPQEFANKKVFIAEIDFFDNAGNQSNYSFNKKSAQDFNMNYYNYNFSFDVISGKNDVSGPVLKNIIFDKTKVKYGDTLKIDVKAMDDQSGVCIATLAFNLNGTNKRFYKEIKADDNGNLIGTYIVPSYNGTYKLTGVYLDDCDGNYTNYGLDDYGGKFSNALNVNYSFVVDGAPDVEEKITISEIKYSYKKLVAPSIYKIGIKLNKDTDLVDTINVIIGKSENDNKTLTAELSKKKNNYFEGYIDIDQFVDVGVYSLKEVILNGKSDSNILNKINVDLKYDHPNLFEISEENDYDVITSTTDKDLINKIKNAKDNAKIAISSTNSSIIKKEVFKAIKGTNKSIYIQANGIQWIFEGKDIKKCKDIDVKVELNYIYNDELNDVLSNIMNKGLVINFVDNGKLPGKALIRIKMDYALRDYLGIENLFAYHFNNSIDEKKLDRVAENISMSEDGNLEFYINHNSSFILTNDNVEEQYVSGKLDDLVLNDLTIEKDLKVVKTKKSFNYVLMGITIGIIIIISVVTFIIIKNNRKSKINL